MRHDLRIGDRSIDLIRRPRREWRKRRDEHHEEERTESDQCEVVAAEATPNDRELATRIDLLFGRRSGRTCPDR
jgi:hypothetical protein